MYLTRAAGIETIGFPVFLIKAWRMYLTRAAGIETKVVKRTAIAQGMYLTRAAGIETVAPVYFEDIFVRCILPAPRELKHNNLVCSNRADL